MGSYWDFFYYGPLYMGSDQTQITYVLYDTTQSWTALETKDTDGVTGGYNYSEPTYRELDIANPNVSFTHFSYWYEVEGI